MPDGRVAIAARIVLGASGLIALAVAVGVALEARCERRLTDRYEPPGEMVDIGSHRLHLYCEGSGEPPVLLEAGSGLAGSNWHAVQSGLSRMTRACIYDRSGLGWSESGPGPPSANQAVEELDLLLDSSGISGPWVVVGHSLGGLYGLQFLHLHAEEVAALVLVDSSFEDMLERVPYLLDRVTPGPLERLKPLGSLVGLHRLSRPTVPESDPSWVARELHATSKHVRRAAAEWWAMPASAAQVRKARVDLSDKPVVVMQAGSTVWPRSWSEGDQAEAERELGALAREVAHRSSRGRHILVEESGHGIPWEEPQAVIAAVDHLLQELRQGARSQSEAPGSDDSGAVAFQPALHGRGQASTD